MHGHYTSIWQAIAERDPDRVAVVTRSRELSYLTLAREAGALATRLREAGLGPGDSLMIAMHNRPEYLVGLYACLASGVAPVLVNFRFRAPELAELIDDSRPAAMLFPSSLADVMVDAAGLAGANAPTLLVCVDDGDGETPSQAVPYAEVVAGGGSLPPEPPAGGELRIYTGGTTGRPKAVVWPAELILDIQDYSIYVSLGLRSPTTIDEAVDIALGDDTPRVAVLPLAPFMHGTALFNGLNALAIGGSIIIPEGRRLDVVDGVRLANDYRATRLIVAGDVVALPIVEAAEELGLKLETVTSIMSSGMRFSEEVKRGLHQLGSFEILDLLAATEGGPFAVNLTRSVDDLPGRFRLLPGAAVLDEDLREVQDTPGATGTLAFRGTLPSGYHGDEEKTRKAFPVIGGLRYVVPGDMAKVLDDGSIELLGRGSSVVNTGGEKVFPAEVEAAILEHDAVRDAVVFGMPDRRYGERVVAVVALEAGAALTRDELASFLDAGIAGYKKPKLVAFVDSLGRTPHGKIDMRRMRDLVAAFDADATEASTKERQ
ncbi:acyl-CoA synthetase [Pseudoclavibacter endophyticus]|uniref:AMP-binding protein n=1 Tax=Pseudoclavibacter endophyticus TaxID=1778590 RepID=UPI001666A07E|nr:AMP-binding protein [Pseudoclavibacter endophyticus]GGA74476.1 acyl-CoA synthetase [Pseudoclavibacter endophyticus]